MKDRSLDSLKALLEKDYRLVLLQVPVLNKKVDLLCFDGKDLIAIETKSKLSELPMAIGQCSFYKQGVHKTYIALPSEEARRMSHERKVLRDLGIGLISFTDRGYNIVLESKRTIPKKQHINEIMEKIRSIKKISGVVEGYKALANQLRLQIYLAISEREELGLKDIIEELGESYPLTIKHVKILENAELIESEKRGKETFLKLKSYPVELKEDLIKKRIVHLLSARKGLKINEISEALNISHGTASKYLMILEIEGKILARETGKAKLYYPRTKMMEAKLK